MTASLTDGLLTVTWVRPLVGTESAPCAPAPVKAEADSEADASGVPEDLYESEDHAHAHGQSHRNDSKCSNPARGGNNWNARRTSY